MQVFYREEEKTLVHFCWDFCSTYLPCQTTLTKHKKWTECTCFLQNAIKRSHQTDFEQTTTSSFTIKVLEDVEWLIQRQSSILFLESPEVGWKGEMEKSTLPKTDIEILLGNAEIVRKALSSAGAQTGNRCQDY